MRPDNLFENQATIKVIGVGGAGSNAVNRMIEEGLVGVKFAAMNTDAQALDACLAPKKIHLGEKGLGAGGDPQKGHEAARSSEEAIRAELHGVDMVFITAGMGGGTGTGAAPVVAEIARRMGILTVAVVTRPFFFEGPRRSRNAEEGAKKLAQNVDTLLTIPNDRLLNVVERRATMQQAFRTADDVLRQGVQGISDIILLPGVINVDFADVRSVMKEAGVAVMGMGRASGENRALTAAERAANSPLLERDIKGARRLLVNITAGSDFSIGEAHEAMEYIQKFADSDEADIIMGHVMRESPDGEVLVTLLAAEMDPVTRRPEATQSVFISRETQDDAVTAEQPLPQTVELGEIDLDIPSFLRRKKEPENS